MRRLQLPPSHCRGLGGRGEGTVAVGSSGVPIWAAAPDSDSAAAELCLVSRWKGGVI